MGEVKNGEWRKQKREAFGEYGEDGEDKKRGLGKVDRDGVANPLPKYGDNGVSGTLNRSVIRRFHAMLLGKWPFCPFEAKRVDRRQTCNLALRGWREQRA